MNITPDHTRFSTPQQSEQKPESVHDRSANGSSPRQHNHARREPSARALLEILRQEILLHVELLNKKREERPCLAVGAATELRKITDDLEGLIEKIRQAEESRAEEMERWARVVGCAPSHITLRMIAPHVFPEEGEKLIEMGDQLKALVIAVRDENNVNQLLLRRSLRLVDEEIRILINNEDEPVGYTAEGSVSHQRIPCGRRLVDCRA